PDTAETTDTSPPEPPPDSARLWSFSAKCTKLRPNNGNDRRHLPTNQEPRFMHSTKHTPRPVDLPDHAFRRTMVTLGRGLLRHCPDCGGGNIFRTWFTLKDRCPHCNTLFAYEDGYFLGSYVLNLVLTSLIAIGVAIYMLFGTDL